MAFGVDYVKKKIAKWSCKRFTTDVATLFVLLLLPWAFLASLFTLVYKLMCGRLTFQECDMMRSYALRRAVLAEQAH